MTKLLSGLCAAALVVGLAGAGGGAPAQDKKKTDTKTDTTKAPAKGGTIEVNESKDGKFRFTVRDGKVPIAIFDGVADRTAAEAMRGQLVEVDRDSLPDLDDGEFYYADLIGLTCFSTDGDTIGSVLSVENFGAGEVLEIELAAGGRAMVPFRDGIADLVVARNGVDPGFLA